jgi:hypothetical protein
VLWLTWAGFKIVTLDRSHEDFADGDIRTNRSTSVSGLKLLVSEALSY